MVGSPGTSHMMGRSKVFKGCRTVIAPEVRRASHVQEGDTLERSLEDDKIVIQPRRRRTVVDVPRLIAHGGDAVASKRKAQGREPDPR